MIASGVNVKAPWTFMDANIRITLDQYGLPLQGAEDEAAGLLDAFLAATSADGLSRLAAPCLTRTNPRWNRDFGLMYYIKRSARRLEGAAGRTPMAARRNRVNVL